MGGWQIDMCEVKVGDQRDRDRRRKEGTDRAQRSAAEAAFADG